MKMQMKKKISNKCEGSTPISRGRCDIASLELVNCFRNRRQKRLLLFLMLSVVIGVLLLTNTSTFGLYGFHPDIKWSTTNLLLASLLAVYYYILPVVVIAGMYDLTGKGTCQRMANALSEYGVKPHETYSGMVLGRFYYLITIVSLSFLVGLLVIAVSILFRGGSLNSIQLLRVFSILLAVELLGLTFFFLVTAVALLAGSSRRSMIWNMVMLVFTIVVVTILSDIVLLYSFGPMPLPGTPTWANYLVDTRNSIGLKIYLLSPTESFLTNATFLAGSTTLSISNSLKTLSTTAAHSGAAFLIFSIVYYFKFKFTPEKST